MTATEASRHFSELLDSVERGEHVTIRRGNRVIAEIRPARARRGRDLQKALAGIVGPDDTFENDIAAALTFVADDRTDPWSDD